MFMIMSKRPNLYCFIAHFIFSSVRYTYYFISFRQLLNDCGIGLTMADSTNTPVVNQHRVLLFCQLKSMLDIVEKDVLKYVSPIIR